MSSMLATKYQRYGYVHMEPFLPGKAIMIQFIIFIIHWNVQQQKNVVVFPTHYLKSPSLARMENILYFEFNNDVLTFKVKLYFSEK